MAVSGDGRVAVSASADNTLKVWDTKNGRELRTLAGHQVDVDGVAVSADGHLAVSVAFDNTLKVWDVVNGRELRTPRGHFYYSAGAGLSFGAGANTSFTV